MAYSFCVSEVEAKQTRTCPRSIGVNPVYGPDGSGIMAGGPFACLGSQCMAWRWVQTYIDDGNGGTETSYNTHGFCGLAGEPYGRHP